MKLRDYRFSRKKTRCSLLATAQSWNTMLLHDWLKRAKYVIIIITYWHYSISTCLNFSLSGICNMRILTFWSATASQGFELTTWKCRIELILLAMRRREERESCRDLWCDVEGFIGLSLWLLMEIVASLLLSSQACLGAALLLGGGVALAGWVDQSQRVNHCLRLVVGERFIVSLCNLTVLVANLESRILGI